MENITNEEIEIYYNVENHSQYECAEHFNISVGLFIKLLKERGIKKDKKAHAAKIKQRKLELHGDANYNNREKSKETCLEKYGVDNVFKDTAKIKAAYIDKLGVDHPMHCDDIKNKVKNKLDYEQIIAKGRETYFNNTGFDNPSKNPECIKKMIKTKIDNHVYDSPGSSNIEKRLEKILKRKFNKVIAHYRDPRYSRESGYEFECDFYIPEEDLFIELNAYPTHSDHPYNPENIKDVNKAIELKKSSKHWEVDRYNTWVLRDKEKIDCAKNNKLNYIILYPTNSIHKNKDFNDKKYSQLIEYLLKKINKKE